MNINRKPKVTLDIQLLVCYHLATMLMIRLQRVGRVNDPSFRVVLTEKRNATKSGKFLEVLGSYNSRGGKAVLNKERVSKWLKDGVQLSDTARNLLINHKLLKGDKVKFIGKNKKKEVSAEAKAPEAAPAQA